METIMPYFAIIFLSLFLTSPAMAAFEGGAAPQGGFSGPGGATATTVQQAKALPDDSYVTLTGSIVSKVGKDDYIFRDSTGEIKVDIDDKYFYNVKVTPQNTVRIVGEVDKDFGKAVEIDVKSLEVLK